MLDWLLTTRYDEGTAVAVWWGQRPAPTWWQLQFMQLQLAEDQLSDGVALHQHRRHQAGELQR